MKLNLSPDQAPLSKALNTWIRYRHQVSLSEHSGKSIIDIWNENFPNLDSGSFFEVRREAGKHIHLATFKQVGHQDVRTAFWSDLNDLYCELTIIGYTVGLTAYSLNDQQISSLSETISQAFNFIQTCDEQTYEQLFYLLKWFMEKDPVLFQPMYSQLLTVFSQLGKNMDEGRTTVFMMRLTIIGLVHSWYVKSNH